MMIIGNGVDIIENTRIQKSIKNKLFLKRIFTKKEIDKSLYLNNKVSYFAKRFAAKEAFVKAIGTGFSNQINFNDIEVLNNKKGKPYISLSTKLKKFLNKSLKLSKYKIFLSLSDEKKFSIAFVIINTK